MSQYMNLFLKSRTNEYLPIANFSRNSEIYRTFNDVCSLRYEAMNPISKAEMNACISEVIARIDQYKSYVAEKRETLNVIMNASDPLEEKLAMYQTYLEDINDMEEDMDNLRSVKEYFKIWAMMLWEADYDSSPYDADNYLYVGWECDPNAER